jgi:hypothetical protein
LVLIESANKEKSFLYQVGDIVSFKVISSIIPSSSRTLKGLIISRYTDGRKYYKIKTLDDKNQYEVHEADIIEKLGICASEPEQQKAEPLSAAKSLEDIGKIIDSINEEKPLNIKIAKKQIKLNFKN